MRRCSKLVNWSAWEMGQSTLKTLTLQLAPSEDDENFAYNIPCPERSRLLLAEKALLSWSEESRRRHDY